jgi:hypothetical protein
MRFDRIFNSANLIWTVVCALGGATFGAVVGYGGAGVIGAVAVAFCGLVLGALLSTIILEVLLKL